MNIFALPLLAIGSSLWLFLSGASHQKNTDTVDDLTNPAVGIALTATYGALSIRHPDGSFEDIGRVDGSGRYISMMQRLSSPEQTHLSPPYSSMDDMWADLPREGPRALKRRLGLPASSDVRILSEMLKPLLDLYPTGETVRSAVISYPAIVALYEEDIIDAAAYLNVRVQGGAHLRQPREMLAAYAGYGRGLCSHPEDKEGCLKELRGLPKVDVLHVEYTAKAMVLHSASLRGAQDNGGEDIDALGLYELGSERRGERIYLEVVEGYLTGFLRERYPTKRSDIVVIISGEEGSVADKDVQEVIRHAVQRDGAGSVELLVSRPEYIAARGAAELCWRGKEFYNGHE